MAQNHDPQISAPVYIMDRIIGMRHLCPVLMKIPEAQVLSLITNLKIHKQSGEMV
jgi:hypothetical protein